MSDDEKDQRGGRQLPPIHIDFGYLPAHPEMALAWYMAAGRRAANAVRTFLGYPPRP